MDRKYTLFALIAIILASCIKPYDDTALKERLDAVQLRLDAIEHVLSEYQTEISTLETLAQAYGNKSYVTDIETIVENGKTVGYKIYFKNLDSTTIMNGEDGQLGIDGKDGASPQVGIVLIDGVYYWTIDGEVMKDESNQPIPASADSTNVIAENGITPIVTIENGKWVVKTGNTTQVWGDVIDTEGKIIKDEIFKGIKKENETIVITLEDGSNIVLPVYHEYAITLTKLESGGPTYTIAYAISGVFNESLSVNVISSSPWTVDVQATDTKNGNFVLTPPSPLVAASFNILATDGEHSIAAEFSVNSNEDWML